MSGPLLLTLFLPSTDSSWRWADPHVLLLDDTVCSGCGEGRLIEGLVLGRHGADCGGPLVEAAGVDISGSGLAAAARRLGKLRAAAAELAELPVDGEVRRRRLRQP